MDVTRSILKQSKAGWSSEFPKNLEITPIEKVVAVFILRPTNVRIWHKAVFKVGPVAGP